MSGTIDWSKEASPEREVYPSGTYLVECTGWQECETRAGKPQIRFFTEIKEPEIYKGKTLIDHTALSEAALWRLANLVQGFGVDLSSVPKMTIGSEGFKKLLDQCVRRTSFWTIIHDEQYNNNKVESYSPDPSQDVKVPEVNLEDPDCPF